MKKWIVVVAVCAALTGQACRALAVIIKSGQSVVFEKKQPADDDIVAAAGQVSITTPVKGDVVAAARNVAIAGPVKDSVMLAGSNVTVAGPVGNDCWLAGETVAVASHIRDNGFLTGNMVTLSRDGAVGKDMLVAGSTVNVLGNVGRDLRAAAGELVIGGTVGRDVYAQAGKVVVMKGAVIKGNLWYESAHKATIQPGATVLGKTIQRLPPKEKAKSLFWSPFAWILGLLMAVVFGAALIVLFPTQSRSTSDTVRGSFWPSLGIGIATLIGVPVLIAVLLITIVGIPIALAMLMIYAVLLYAAWILGALALGQWILDRREDRAPKLFGSMILGVVILALLGLVPYIGCLFKFAAMVVGLGGFLISWWRSRTPTPVPPPAEAG